MFGVLLQYLVCILEGLLVELGIVE
jgi:hypothetical protein